MRRHVPTDMVLENLLYMNTNYRHLTVFLTKTEEDGGSSTARQPTKPSDLDILWKAAKYYTYQPDKK